MTLNLLGLPLLSFLSCSLLGRYLGTKGSTTLSTLLIGLSALLSTVLFYEVGLMGCPVFLDLGSWISPFQIRWSFRFDSLALILSILVTTVSALVHLYSIGYMKGDPHLPRFMSYLSLFTFFMLFLVTSENLVQLFIGWEGVGICSYLLINFWFTRIQANKAALKAVWVNRVGDIGVLLGIVTLYYLMKTLDLSLIESLAPYLKGVPLRIWGVSIDGLTLVALCLTIGVVGKSAQLFLHTWLPDAMEGPTPVSALIHAATMVTAGVFLILRTSSIFEQASSILILLTLIGGATAFFAATTASFQNDLKKVIAFSTCSQLGYMVLACGVSQYSLSLFHLLNHGFFKALLFLSAGSIIHALSDEQDLRRMGGLISFLPITFSVFLIGSLSLIGFPFLTGFYSKDLILEGVWSFQSPFSTYGYLLALISALLTAFYSTRALFLTFLSLPNYLSSKAPDSSVSLKTMKIHESSPGILCALIFLALASIFMGYLTKEMLTGIGTPFWNGALISNLSIEVETLSPLLKGLPILVAFMGMATALSLYSLIPQWWREVWRWASVYSFFNQKWYWDTVWNGYLVRPILEVGYQLTFKLIDRGILELLGPYGLVRWYEKGPYLNWQTGKVYHYALVMIVGVTFYFLPISIPFLILALMMVFFI